jgi:hypothetical protein
VEEQAASIYDNKLLGACFPAPECRFPTLIWPLLMLPFLWPLQVVTPGVAYSIGMHCNSTDGWRRTCEAWSWPRRGMRGGGKDGVVPLLVASLGFWNGRGFFFLLLLYLDGTVLYSNQSSWSVLYPFTPLSCIYPRMTPRVTNKLFGLC